MEVYRRSFLSNRAFFEQDCAGITQIMLEHGADPNVECVIRRQKFRFTTKVDLLDILQESFDDDYRMGLEALVHEKRASLQPSCSVM